MRRMQWVGSLPQELVGASLNAHNNGVHYHNASRVG